MSLWYGCSPTRRYKRLVWRSVLRKPSGSRELPPDVPTTLHLSGIVSIVQGTASPAQGVTANASHAGGRQGSLRWALSRGLEARSRGVLAHAAAKNLLGE